MSFLEEFSNSYETFDVDEYIERKRERKKQKQKDNINTLINIKKELINKQKNKDFKVFSCEKYKNWFLILSYSFNKITIYNYFSPMNDFLTTENNIYNKCLEFNVRDDLIIIDQKISLNAGKNFIELFYGNDINLLQEIQSLKNKNQVNF